MSVTIPPEWQAQIDEAQEETTIEIGDQIFERVKYGDDYDFGAAQCRDCGVEFGQVHVFGCCVERCARCGAQAYGCPCVTYH